MAEPVITLVDEQPEAVAELETTALTTADEARSLKITNDSEYEAAGHFLRTEVKAVLKRADEIFDPSIKAAHESHKAAIKAKKEATADLVEAEKAVKRLMGQYAQDQERKRIATEAEAERQRHEEAETLRAFGADDEAESVEATPATVQKAKPKAEGVSIRRRWTFELLDASKLKPEFLVPDTTKIQKVVNALKEDAAGAVGEGAIKVTETSDVAVRV